MIVYTRPAKQVFAQATAAGKVRGASMGEAQAWGTEIEKAIGNLEDRLGLIPSNPIADWIELHSA